ncbi:MAG: HDOD domain-containing protein [Oligoflexia bacterium]|nr:HDOD domain-containing protein [Oligoflexia bacterium]
MAARAPFPAKAPGPTGLGGARPAGLGSRSAAADDNRKVEDRVFSIPNIVQPKDCPAFSDFFEKVVPRINLPYTSRHIIEAFSNIDVKAERVAQILRANQYYEAILFRIVESLGKRESVERLEGAIVLLGMQNTRNTMIALQLLRMVKGGHPEWTKEGKLKVNPAEVLKYALRTEELLSGRKDGYSDTAYAAGLIFDILALLASEMAQDKKKTLATIDAVYLHGLRTAQIAAEISSSIPDFGFKKYVFSACLIHDIGKIIHAIINPAYSQFIEDSGKKELPRQIRHFAERQRFGVSHSLLGGLCCEYFHAFQPVQKAILYHHNPYLIKGGMDGLGQLASLICLSTNIANNFKKAEKADDPILPLWKGVELADFPVDVPSLLKAVSRVV